MDTRTKPAPAEIRQARVADPDLRERELARRLGISEADYVAAQCGITVRRIKPFARELLGELPRVGEVMTLTRNESAVHETIGTYGRFMSNGGGAAAAIGDNINLRLFFRHWVHGFAVEKQDGDKVRRSLQFFDQAGDAIQKIHLRPDSNVEAYEAIVRRLISEDQSQTVETRPYEPTEQDAVTVETFSRHDALRDRWGAMQDVHEFFGILQEIGVSRHVAVQSVGAEFAWPVERSSVTSALEQISAAGMPAMCFVGSRGCVQIYGGPISRLKTVGPWFNVMDPTFHLHLRADHIAEVWALHRPIAEGHLSSLEGYDAEGRLIIQFFGVRQAGKDEPAEWRALVDALPRIPHPVAA